MTAERIAEVTRIYFGYDPRKEGAARARAAVYGKSKPKQKKYKVETFRSGSPYTVDCMISRFYKRMSGKEGFRVVNVSYEVVVLDTVAHVHYEVME